MTTETIQAGSQFNQQLITKARKGEIAILNDGSVEELRTVIEQIWPDSRNDQIMGYDKLYRKIAGETSWVGCQGTNLPAHSAKDFFMPDTKTSKQIGITIDTTGLEGDSKTVVADPPRTYKVTRQQMKEIWEVAPCQGAKNKIVEMTTAVFDPFGIEAELNKTEVGMIVDQFDEPLPDLLKLVFTPYFHIPEGEPVLVRHNMAILGWFIRVSDGNGSYYEEGRINGESSNSGNMEIIPFTKNPPK